MPHKKKPVEKTKTSKPRKGLLLKAGRDRVVQAEGGAKQACPIVGIGTSAGGLEALELFFANMPADKGIAFVVIQHLNPTHKDMLVELLQRRTAMQVFQIQDRMRVEANCVYVLPPNKDVSILHGVLHLLDPLAPRGLRLPIDFFFRALADDQRGNSFAVILSGMGADGTLGLRAIKGQGGMSFVQEPSSAKFDGMPQSAIKAGVADVVAPVEVLPGKIVAYLQRTPLIALQEPDKDEMTRSELEKVVILLRSHSQHDFSQYKRTTLYRRVERRMGIHQIETISIYVRYLQENPQEVEILFRELLIGVTNFFRDPAAWEQLKAEVLPSLLAELTPNQTVRVWVAACSTGEEAYSLAILFREALDELKVALSINVQIFATDLDAYAIEQARVGVFPATISADVSVERLSRFFTQTERGYQVAKSIRDMVIFAPQNVIGDPPFTKLHLLSCRNLLIYLTPELQKKLLPLFHYCLNPGGFLFLGNAETIGGFTNLLSPLPGKARLYQRLPTSSSHEPVEFPASFVPRPHTLVKELNSMTTLQALAEQLLLQTYAPAAVLTSEKGDILYISGHTGNYLEPASGKANWNLLAMARDEIRYELTKALHKALQKKETITVDDLAITVNNKPQHIRVTVQPVFEAKSEQAVVLVVFNDVPLPPVSKRGTPTRRTTTRTSPVAELERDLNRARHEAQTLREEMQTAQEELQSTNEELQSTNEELQSTNEELTTSKEELQSMNEELQTVNHELQAKLEDLSRTNNDMKNLLDSTDIATLFLDNDVRVRRFTNQISKITRLIPSDVGRPITDISSALLYPDLADDVHEVLRTLVSIERQIMVSTETWYMARILPYRTIDNFIDGVVITFVNITNSKRLEIELRATEARLRDMLDRQ